LSVLKTDDDVSSSYDARAATRRSVARRSMSFDTEAGLVP
jgi:hypothetical protein